MLDPSLFWTLTPNTCSFPTCEIMAAGCSDAYTGTNIKIVNGKEIHGRLNIDAGYTETICAKCFDSDGTFMTKDSIELKQNGKPCNFAEAVPALTPTVLGWKNSAAYFDILDLTQFWTSSESTCSISQCEIR